MLFSKRLTAHIVDGLHLGVDPLVSPAHLHHQALLACVLILLMALLLLQLRLVGRMLLMMVTVIIIVVSIGICGAILLVRLMISHHLLSR